jgi:FkbM family methyltransferase
VGIRRTIRKLARAMGYEKIKPPVLPEVLERRRKLLAAYDVDLIIDVGANTGQFAQEMRRTLGYTGRIVSFEPLQSAFSQLAENARTDPNWTVLNYALGERNERRELHIAGNSYSSSVLPMLESHAQAAPESVYVGSESIEIKTLDSVFASIKGNARRCYLKIDTQGFELPVLLGAEASLASIDTVQLELSVIPLYEGQSLYLEMCSWFAERGYELVSIEPGFGESSSGRMLQFDGVFHRFRPTH